MNQTHKDEILTREKALELYSKGKLSNKKLAFILLSIGSCEECKHYMKNELGQYCYITLQTMPEDGFCSLYNSDEFEDEYKRIINEPKT